MRVLTIIGILALSACASSAEERDSDEGGVAGFVGDWHTDLSSRNDSGVRGDVAVQSAFAAMGLTISVSGATAGAQLPWHVHRGTCSTGGPIVGSANDYPLLVAGSDGTARAAVSVGTPLSEQERYHVNVHRSPSELNVIVACGDLEN